MSTTTGTIPSATTATSTSATTATIPGVTPGTTTGTTRAGSPHTLTPAAPFVERLALALDLVAGRLARFLTRWSVPALRVSLGLVFLVFGALKAFPGASPAADIAARTIEALTLGIVHGDAAVYLTAVLEVFIGVTLVTGRLLRLGLLVLAGAFVGILSPAVLFADELFGHGMTLMGQYILKDVVLVAAAAVVTATALGARLRER